MAQENAPPLKAEVKARENTSRKKGWWQHIARMEGFIVTLLFVVLFFILSAFDLAVLNAAPILLVAVVYAAFRGGTRLGLYSALLTVVYYIYFFSTSGHLFRYTPDNLARLLILILVSSLMAVLVGGLQQRSIRASQRLLEQARLHERGLRLLNEQLELRVRERTAQLDTTVRAERGARLQAETNAKQLSTSLLEREVLEKALRESEQSVRQRANQMETIFESMVDGVNVYGTDGQILYTNAAYARILGIDDVSSHLKLRQEERGDQLMLMDEQGRLLTNEQRPVHRMLEGETLVDANTVEILIRTFDGRERQLSITGAPTRDQDGSVNGGVLIFRDVTERRQLEHRTQESLEALLAMAEELVRFSDERDTTSPQDVAKRLATLIRNVLGCRRVALTSVEPGTGVVRSTAVVGLLPELEEKWNQRLPGFNLDEQLRGIQLQEYLEANEVLVIDYDKPPLQGKSNPFGIRTMLIAFMKVGKQLVGVLTLDFGDEKHEYTDRELHLARAIAKLSALVFERERLLEERAQAQANELALREANRRMDEFLGIASHEIRTPLTSIRANVQLAQRQVKRLQQQNDQQVPAPFVSHLVTIQEMLDRAIRQTSVQNRLVSDLLDVSRIYAGKLELRIAQCEVVSIVRRTVEDQRQIVTPRPISLDIQANELVVLADADRVEQVVNNYLSNALKYSEASRSVDVRVARQGNAVCVSVSDEGPGLTPEQQQHIWERFYRVESIQVKSGSGVGLGLGLHICRTIIERQGGQVGVESISGKGSTFWFTLPLLEDDETGKAGDEHSAKKVSGENAENLVQ